MVTGKCMQKTSKSQQNQTLSKSMLTTFLAKTANMSNRWKNGTLEKNVELLRAK